MQFPKQFMRAGELRAMGLPEGLLRRAYGARGQKFAQKMNPLKRNSPLVFDTEGLGEWLKKDAEAQSRGMNRG